MTLSLSQEKKEEKSPMHRASRKVTRIGQGIKKIDRVLLFTVLPASLQYWALQHQQIQGKISKSSLEGQLSLSKQAREELHWWKQNISLYNGKSLISPPNSTDNKFRCITPRLGTSFQEKSTGGP